MRLYNTLNRTIEDFVPNESNIVKMYTCGPTVYNYAHIGNLRTYISEDVLEKALNYLGYNVKRVMNITDVGHMVGDSDNGEDKMSVASSREHKSALQIAKFYTDAFFNDCLKLNIKKPEVVSYATENIDQYIKVISKLLDDGYAYIAGGNVYFDVTKYPDYYELSNRRADELEVGIRDTVDEDFNKKNPYDFGLWFTNSKFNNQELKWNSPWGIGYPGWHIECSCIALKYLGEKLDIHCGAVDAIFPHHTNEIAQTECYTGHKWCNYWIHFAFLNNRNGKMSKSSGEFLTLSLLESKGYDPLAYRYFVLGSHYRKPLEFSYDALDGAVSAYKKLKARIALLKDDSSYNLVGDKYKEVFKDAIGNDLNTSNMITIIYDLLKDDELNDSTKIALIKEFDTVLGLNLIDVQVDNHFDEEILILVELRNEAKKNKEFLKADTIRDELLAKGIRLLDTRDGTKIERID